MDIESILRRAGGTHVTIGATDYSFLPHPDYAGAHVALVEDEAHIRTFLAIEEGFREAVKPGEARPAAPVAPKPRKAVVDQTDLPAPPAGVLPEAPADEPDDEPDAPAPQGTSPAITAEQIDAMEPAELAALFERLEGRKPGPATKPETLRAKLKEIALT